MPAQSIAPAVLLTRPPAQSDAFAHCLQASVPGLRVVVSPLMAPVFLKITLPECPIRGVILTSQTGAEAAAGLRPHLPDLAYCVGDRTAQVAQEAGFRIRSAQGNAEALLALILRDPVQPLLHLRGREARGDLAERLSAAGCATQERIVYAQEAQSLNAQAVDVLTGEAPVIVPLFSPRSAEIFVAAWQALPKHAPLHVVAISAAVAQAQGVSQTLSMIVPHPDGPSMLRAVLLLVERLRGP